MQVLISIQYLTKFILCTYYSYTKFLYTNMDFNSAYPLKNQDFYKLRQECLQSCYLFKDAEFPPNQSSIGYGHSSPQNVVWLRPQEITYMPQFFVNGFDRFDVQQGQLGDCWFLAAVADLTLHEKLFNRVVPSDQSFQGIYAGIFHFRFWQYCRWVDVVIDDYLPTVDGRLCYMKSSTGNEFWSCLLEKAYAKLYGSYEALDGGSANEAMLDFTGGVSERYDLKNNAPPNLFSVLLKAHERDSLISCSITADPYKIEAEAPFGLIRGHAYSVTSVRYAHIKTPRKEGKIPLIRLRNPWGNDTEWTGPWSDRSEEWRFIPADEKRRMDLEFSNDGEFWMAFDDFKEFFDELEICNLSPDGLDEEINNRLQWETSVFAGKWIRGATAGGCRNYRDTFHQNPQYRITLVDPDDEDDEDLCTVIVALTQKTCRGRGDFLNIGFSMIAINDPETAPKPLTKYYLARKPSFKNSGSFFNDRDVSCRFKVPPGVYCIIPSTFQPEQEGEFILRIFTEKKSETVRSDNDSDD